MLKYILIPILLLIGCTERVEIQEHPVIEEGTLLGDMWRILHAQPGEHYINFIYYGPDGWLLFDAYHYGFTCSREYDVQTCGFNGKIDRSIEWGE